MTRKIPSHLPAVLMLGIVSQIGQVLFLRELLMVFHGSELSLGIIFAAWLVWVGMGSRLGAVLVDRVNRPLFLLILTAAGVLLMLPATILLMRGLRGIFNVLPGAYLSLLDITISSFLLMAPACLLFGAQFVLLSRVWRESNRAEDTSSAGKTYIGEAVGNMLGGLLFTFLIVHHLNSFQSAFLTAMLMTITILFITWKPVANAWCLPARFRPTLLVLLAVAAFAFPFLEELDERMYKIHWRYFTPLHQLVETHQSKYGTISVVQREDQYSFFQSGHLVFSTAGPKAAGPGLEEQEAVTFAHLSMVQHEKPVRILLIGGGLRGTLSEMIKHPVERIDYIELDEVLTKAALPYVSPATLEALADPRVRLIHTDGRLFVKVTQEKYDLIIVDVPDPATAVLNRFYTREFFQEAKALLRPGGVFVIGVMSTPDMRGTAVANRNATIYHTLRSVFSHVLSAGAGFMFFFATDTPGQVSVDAHTLQERYRGRNIETEGFSPQHYHTLLQESQLRRVNWIVRNHGRSRDAHLEGAGTVPLDPGTIADQESAEKQLPPVERSFFINSDLKPIGYFYTLVFLDDLTRAGHGKILKWLLQVQFWWILSLFCLPLLVASGLRIAARHGRKTVASHFAVLFAVFSTGFSTMTLQIALLFSFQSIYGFIYEIVGLIVALFMCGLALGALSINRYMVDKANIYTLAGVLMLIALFAGLTAVVLPEVAAERSPTVVFALFSTLTFVTGLINGVEFPLAAACSLALTRHAEKSVGDVYGMELFGACVGAALASVVVAPILGIVACCLMASIANVSAFVVILISRRSYSCQQRNRPMAD